MSTDNKSNYTVEVRRRTNFMSSKSARNSPLITDVQRLSYEALEEALISWSTSRSFKLRN